MIRLYIYMVYWCTDLAVPLRPNGIIQIVPDVLRLQMFSYLIQPQPRTKFILNFDEEITIINTYIHVLFLPDCEDRSF